MVLVFAGDTIIKGASLNATGKPTAALEAKYQLYQLVQKYEKLGYKLLYFTYTGNDLSTMSAHLEKEL